MRMAVVAKSFSLVSELTDTSRRDGTFDVDSKLALERRLIITNDAWTFRRPGFGSQNSH